MTDLNDNDDTASETSTTVGEAVPSDSALVQPKSKTRTDSSSKSGHTSQSQSLSERYLSQMAIHGEIPRDYNVAYLKEVERNGYVPPRSKYLAHNDIRCWEGCKDCSTMNGLLLHYDEELRSSFAKPTHRSKGSSHTTRKYQFSGGGGNSSKSSGMLLTDAEGTPFILLW